jgi:glycosyltransferase involved in cell wall biosynthesis
MTTVVINAISVREGGSVVVLRELLAYMSMIRPLWRWHVVVNSRVRSPLSARSNVEYVCYPQVDQSRLKTRLWYETGLHGLVDRVGADALFSMTNYLPLRSVTCPTLLLVQNAGHFSPLFSQLTESRLSLPGRVLWRNSGRWVKHSVRVADAVTVQTAALARQIADETRTPLDHIRIVSHGPGQAAMQSMPAMSPGPNEKFRVGYITKFGVQKNFAVLFKALGALTKKGMPLTLVLTLSEELAANQAVLESTRQYGLTHIIENQGELSANEIGSLYKTLHAFVFPSLCESFGFPLVEAMAYGIPLLVADVDSNVEVGGAGALPFPAHDADKLARDIERLASDANWFQERAQASLQRSADFNWKQAADKTVSLLEEVVVRHVPATAQNSNKQ